MPGKKKSAPSSSSLLSTALKDLEVQIKSLKKDKASFQADLKRISNALDVDRDLERALQEKIGGLVEKEASLNERRKKIQSQIDQVSDKINKVSRIKSEMSDV